MDSYQQYLAKYTVYIGERKVREALPAFDLSDWEEFIDSWKSGRLSRERSFIAENGINALEIAKRYRKDLEKGDFQIRSEIKFGLFAILDEILDESGNKVDFDKREYVLKLIRERNSPEYRIF